MKIKYNGVSNGDDQLFLDRREAITELEVFEGPVGVFYVDRAEECISNREKSLKMDKNRKQFDVFTDC